MRGGGEEGEEVGGRGRDEREAGRTRKDPPEPSEGAPTPSAHMGPCPGQGCPGRMAQLAWSVPGIKNVEDEPQEGQSPPEAGAPFAQRT